MFCLQELRNEFDKEGLMLTAAFSGSEKIAEDAYDLRELSKLLDQIHIKSYDYHGSWDNYTAHSAPLFAPPGNLSVTSSVRYYISQGVDSQKLVLGLPLFGRTFLLKDAFEIGSAYGKMIEGGFRGPITQEDGMMGYNEVAFQWLSIISFPVLTLLAENFQICNELVIRQNHWYTYWDPKAKVPFMRNGAKWISFDNPESLHQKVNQ